MSTELSLLKREIVKTVKAAKKQQEFSDKLNALYPGVYYKPSDFKAAVTQALISVCPELRERLDASPITNGTANAVASSLA